ncbi:MAG TPA: glycosyltransferase family 1 protein [Candidatus Baltobacteraceae bacterium]|nr:glycosyltransferase family 1 protein [Candidatus Baltobacteraceae bacterium]
MSTIDIALDVRLTSHMSVGMQNYSKRMVELVPRNAPGYSFACFGAGDNFDFAEQLEMPSWVVRNDPRLVHYLAPFLPVVQLRPFIVTVHDLIELRYPEFSKPKAQHYYRWICAPIVRRAAAIIVPDSRVAVDLVREFGVLSERIHTVPLGCDAGLFEHELPPEGDRPYLLNVGNHRGHKDVATLLAAWARLPIDAVIDLKFTGKNDVPNLVRSFSRPDAHVEFLGDIPDAKLAAVYAGARAYVHPAILEGYGLPMLEAAAVGTAVIAAETSIPDALAAHALTFAPRDIAALANLLERAVRDPAAMRACGMRLRAAARPFTWERCAAETAKVYNEIFAGLK